MQRKRYLTPLTWPAISFAAMILLGTLALCLPVMAKELPSPWWMLRSCLLPQSV